MEPFTRHVRTFLQGQEDHLALPLLCRGDFSNQQQIFNGLANGIRLRDQDQPGHGLLGLQLSDGVCGHRSHVVRHDDASLCGGEHQDGQVRAAA